MGNLVTPTDSFERKVKRLLKKFPTLSKTLLELEENLIKNPFLGAKLHANTYKIRVSDKSKGKGKSGGFRIITYLINYQQDSIEILLLAIYDKSETSSLTSAEIKFLIDEVSSIRKS